MLSRVCDQSTSVVSENAKFPTFDHVSDLTDGVVDS